MRAMFTKGLLAASISAALFLGSIPDMGGSWGDGVSAVGQVYAAGGKGRGAGSGGGGHDGGSHDGGSHSDSSHDDGHTDHDHDDSDHDHDDGGHDSSSGSKGKGPQYRGGRTGSRGRGGADGMVINKIFDSK